MSTKNKKQKKKMILAVVGILAGICAAGAVALAVFLYQGKNELEETGKYAEQAYEPLPDYHWLTVGGRMYSYRDGLINILCLGVDGRGRAEADDTYGFGPKADCIYLAVLDMENRTAKLINISRDSKVPIRWFDSTGKEIGLYDWQLGLQYTMGNGLEESCELMEEAVSRMLGGIPIHGYCALYWNGVSALQEELGNITLDVTEELSRLDSSHFPESGEQELTPEQIQIFVQGRDIKVTGSNEIRRERQQQYLRALYREVQKRVRRNPCSIWKMKSAVEDYLVTDLDTDEIAALSWQLGARNWEFPEIVNVPGTSVATEFQDEYQIDEAGLTDLVIDTFYRKTGQ